MNFDFTINVGNVIAGVVLIVSFVVAHTQNVKRLQDIETKVGMIYTWFFNTVITRKEE